MTLSGLQNEDAGERTVSRESSVTHLEQTIQGMLRVRESGQ